MTKPKTQMSLPMRQHLKLLASLEGASTEGKALALNYVIMKALEGKRYAKKEGSGYRITLLGLIESRKAENK